MTRWLNGLRGPCGRVLVLIVIGACVWPGSEAWAQGVTTGSIAGLVVDEARRPVPGVSIMAIHDPSGTTYETTSRGDGRFIMPGLRVGGPYTVIVTYAGGETTAFEPHTQENVFVSLGVATDLDFTVRAVAVEEEITVVAQAADAIFSSQRTGAATTVSRDVITALPVISGRLDDIARLTPQARGGSFGGQDDRLNNITIDGSYFNNSFGLAGQPGDRTDVAPISLEAIEEVQISIAPFDVRQGNFVGAGVNTVTRSGTNQFHGFFTHQLYDESFVGTEAKSLAFDPGTFNYRNTDGWVSGPIVQNRAFFFFNLGGEATTRPGTTFTANPGGAPVEGNMTRVLESDLSGLHNYLGSNFGYETGGFQGYDHETPALRVLPKVDFNINPSNRVTARYVHLNSDTDVLVSNSSSLGFGNRRSNTTGLNFENSNYKILENIRSIVGEWHSVLGSRIVNNLIVGYTHQDESRDFLGSFFPMVDILEGSTVYTTFGFEPFTPNNELRYDTFQLQNSLTMYANRHSLIFGASVERYESENVFFPGSQSAYVYNSLADFFTDADDHLANPNRTTSPVELRRFQVRWMNVPGLEKPIQPLRVWYVGGYAQDDWRVNDHFTVSAGLRFDVPFFGETGFANADADGLTFRDAGGGAVQYSTAKLPDANVLWSPRVGFNWDVGGRQSTQVRGGSGVFTGKPAYVWISNQIGNTGVLTGFERLDDTTARPWHPDPNHYKPANVTGAPASSYELALTNPDFKFPQLWRTNVAVDQRLGGGWTGTAEFAYDRDVNGMSYINANLAPPDTAFTGADNRPRWTEGNRIHGHVDNAIVLGNQSDGDAWNITGSLERRYSGGFWIKGGYNYGQSKNTVSPGSIAFGSWNGNQHPGDPNNPGTGFAFSSPGHRLFAMVSYTRDWFRFGGTSVALFWEGRTLGNASYVFGGDLNGDGGTGNDLIYIHRDMSEMNFVATSAFTAEQQAQAWDAYIEQDSYLSQNRGRYAERGAVFLPMVYRADLSVSQDFFANIGGRRNQFRFRLDILNVANLLNRDWGVGQRLVNGAPLIPAGADAEGRAQYTLRAIDGGLMSRSLEQTASLDDVYRIQIGLSYRF